MCVFSGLRFSFVRFSCNSVPCVGVYLTVGSSYHSFLFWGWYYLGFLFVFLRLFSGFGLFFAGFLCVGVAVSFFCLFCSFFLLFVSFLFVFGVCLWLSVMGVVLCMVCLFMLCSVLCCVFFFLLSLLLVCVVCVMVCLCLFSVAVGWLVLCWCFGWCFLSRDVVLLWFCPISWFVVVGGFFGMFWWLWFFSHCIVLFSVLFSLCLFWLFFFVLLFLALFMLFCWLLFHFVFLCGSFCFLEMVWPGVSLLLFSFCCCWFVFSWFSWCCWLVFLFYHNEKESGLVPWLLFLFFLLCSCFVVDSLLLCLCCFFHSLSLFVLVLWCFVSDEGSHPHLYLCCCSCFCCFCSDVCLCCFSVHFCCFCGCCFFHVVCWLER